MKLLPAGLALLLCGVGIVCGCGTTRRGEPIIGRHDPPNEAVAHGNEVFDEYCSKCHPGGEAGLGPSINDKPLPAFLIKFQVRRGLGAMPGFSEDVISTEELDDLAAYLIWLRHTP